MIVATFLFWALMTSLGMIAVLVIAYVVGFAVGAGYVRGRLAALRKVLGALSPPDSKSRP